MDYYHILLVVKEPEQVAHAACRRTLMEWLDHEAATFGPVFCEISPTDTPKSHEGFKLRDGVYIRARYRKDFIDIRLVSANGFISYTPCLAIDFYLLHSIDHGLLGATNNFWSNATETDKVECIFIDQSPGTEAVGCIAGKTPFNKLSGRNIIVNSPREIALLGAAFCSFQCKREILSQFFRLDVFL